MLKLQSRYDTSFSSEALSAGGACHALGKIGRSTLYQLIHNGHLASVKALAAKARCARKRAAINAQTFRSKRTILSPWVPAETCESLGMKKENKTTAAVSNATFPPISYDIPTACRLASIGRSTLYEAIKTGAIETRKLGTRRLVLADSLTAFVKGLPST